MVMFLSMLICHGDLVVDEFQSHGACSKTCRSDYAFAVIQGFSCWCSDYIPADTTSTEDCSDTCPGFGTESCGSTSKDLYVYLPLVKPPSGTQGAASSTAESSSEVVSNPHFQGTPIVSSPMASSAISSISFAITMTRSSASSSTSSFPSLDSGSTPPVSLPPLPIIRWTFTPSPSHLLSSSDVISSASPILTIISLQSISAETSLITVSETVTISPSAEITPTTTVRIRTLLFPLDLFILYSLSFSAPRSNYIDKCSCTS